MLAYLALTGETHTRHALIGLLWGESPEDKAKNSLRVTLSKLRKLLPHHLAVTRQTIAIASESDIWLDTQALAGCLQSAADKDSLLTALNLYRGDLLAEIVVDDAFEFEEWLLSQRAYWQGVALHGLDRLTQALLTARAYDDVIRVLNRRLEIEPWHEDAYRQLMLAYSRLGNYNAALAQFERCQQMLWDELNVEPMPETEALYTRIVTARAAKPPQLPATATPFIGREAELHRISQHLADPACRLLTIIGFGGAGKTRLALAAAQRANQEQMLLFLNGARFVSLAALSEPDDLPHEIAQALDLRLEGRQDPLTQLSNHLRDREMLLVLDNFEQLLTNDAVNGCDHLTHILHNCPGVKILVTCREALQVRDEWRINIGGLLHSSSPREDARDCAATRLFMQAAQRAQPNFTLDRAANDDRAAVGRICRMLGGAPLAIELAAAWLRALSLTQILTEVERSLDFLTTTMRDVPARQRSVRAIFDQTWSLLSAADQRIFCTLAVFRNGFTREAGRAVSGAGPADLTAFVDRALLQWDEARGRYQIHELLRQFAEERLTILGHDVETRHAHSRYYTRLMAAREADLKGHDQLAAINAIEVDFENVRLAWQWAVEHRDVIALAQAMESLHLFADFRGRHRDGIDLYRLGYESFAPTPGQTPEPIWGKMLSRYTFMQIYAATTPDDCVAMAKRGLAIARAQGDASEIAFAGLALGNVLVAIAQRPAEALPILQQALSLLRAVDDRFYQASALIAIAICYVYTSEFDEFHAATLQSLETAHSVGDKMLLGINHNNLAEVLVGRGDYGAARTHAEDAIALAEEMRLHGLKANALALVALLDFLHGDMVSAGDLSRTSLHRAEEIQFMGTIALAMATRSLWAGVIGNSDLAGELSAQSLANPACHDLGLMSAHWGAAIAACGQGDDEAAWAALRTMALLSREFNAPATLVWMAPVAALLIARSGRPEEAIELLAVEASHPLRSGDWSAQWRLLTELRADLEAELGLERWAAAWATGQTKGAAQASAALSHHLNNLL